MPAYLPHPALGRARGAAGRLPVRHLHRRRQRLPAAGLRRHLRRGGNARFRAAGPAWRPTETLAAKLAALGGFWPQAVFLGVAPRARGQGAALPLPHLAALGLRRGADRGLDVPDRRSCPRWASTASSGSSGRSFPGRCMPRPCRPALARARGRRPRRLRRHAADRPQADGRLLLDQPPELLPARAFRRGRGPVRPGRASASALGGAILQMFNHGDVGGGALLLRRACSRRGREAGAAGRLRRRPGRGSGLRRACAAIAMFSSLGLPGLNGFVGEFLIFRGVFGPRALGGGAGLPGPFGAPRSFSSLLAARLPRAAPGRGLRPFPDVPAAETAVLVPSGRPHVPVRRRAPDPDRALKSAGLLLGGRPPVAMSLLPWTIYLSFAGALLALAAGRRSAAAARASRSRRRSAAWGAALAAASRFVPGGRHPGPGRRGLDARPRRPLPPGRRRHQPDLLVLTGIAATAGRPLLLEHRGADRASSSPSSSRLSAASTASS